MNSRILTLNRTVFLLLSLAVASCKKEGNVGLFNSVDGIGAELSDTATVQVSNYQFPALPTSAKSTLLVGKTNDAETGELSVKGYFRVGNSAISNMSGSLPSDAVFDSLSIALPYNTYYYGDTTASQEIFLHRLTEEIVLTEISSAWEDDELPVFASGAAIYSNDHFDYDPIPLGSAIFRPRPHMTSDTLKIKLDDALGNELWNRILAYDNSITSSEDFLQYLKGFVLVPSEGAKSITGFYTDSLTMNIHYSYTGSDGMKTHSFMSMSVEDNTYQFNSIAINRQNSVLGTLDPTIEGEVSSSQTQNKAYIQGLSGLVTKIKFPYMDEMMNRNDLALNKAELIIASPNTEQGIYPSPSSLVLLVADDYGTPTAILPLSYESTGTQLATLTYGYADRVSNNSYSFDLTEYLSAYRGATNNAKKALYLSLPLNDLTETANRLHIAAGEDKPLVYLKLIYTKH